MSTNTQSDRLSRVEGEVQGLKEGLEEYKAENKTRLDLMDKKLDALIALRNKGAGVLWILSGVAFVFVEMFHYFWSK